MIPLSVHMNTYFKNHRMEHLAILFQLIVHFDVICNPQVVLGHDTV